MVERNQPDPTDRLFPVDHKKQFNRILREQNLKFDREGNRTLDSALEIQVRGKRGVRVLQKHQRCCSTF